MSRKLLLIAIVPGAVSALLLSRALSAQTGAPATFTKDVAPIVFDRCVTCHRPGELAPFSLLTYDDVRQHARQIAAATKSRFMPPWKPEPQADAFAGDRRLTDEQIQVFQRWLDQGTPEGNRADLPPAPQFETTWQLGTAPDLVVSMPEPFDVPADGKDVFRNIVLRVPVTSERFVQAIEFRPGNARVVHHARVLVDESDASRWRDAQDPGPGFGGMDAPEAHVPDGHFIGWAAGKLPTRESLPWPIAPGTDLVIQMHLRPTGKPERLQASVGFYFTDRPPAGTPVMLRLGSRTIDIPPGNAGYAIDDTFVLPVNVSVMRIYPHAHYLGKEMSVTAKLPDGTTKSLLHIANWDFNWQDEYEYAKPVVLPQGTTISLHFTYDNSSANAHNPRNPPVRVRFGPNATDEMGELLLQLLPGSGEDFARLRADVTRKVLLGDIAGDEKRIADTPNDDLAHNSLGVAYFQTGRTDDALKQFNEAARLGPNNPVAHFNIALIGMLQGRLDEAVSELQRAVALRPDYAEAHNNLGVLLMRQGSLDQAIGQFREVVRVHPDGSDAHYNLGRALMAANQTGEAVDHFRRALVVRPNSLPMTEDLAWILSTSADDSVRRPAEAVTLAERAAQLTGRRSASVLDTLGAAYASAGQYDEAATAARSAIDLANAAGSPEVSQYLYHLAFYLEGKPYRDTAGVK